MELIFLGTSQAIPTASRNHVSIFLKYENESMLFDCGEGTQRQLRIAKINPCKLTRLLITHWHGDHILGIPGLLQTLALNNYSKTLFVYGPRGTKKFMEMLLDMFVFVGSVKLKIEEIKKGIFFEGKQFFLQAHELKHTCPALAYCFVEKEKRKIIKEKISKLKLPGPLIGKLQKGNDVEYKKKIIKASDFTYIQKGKKIAFVLDTALCKNAFLAASNADLLICEATYTKDMEEKAAEYKHLTAEQAATIAKNSNAKKLVLTHISQRYEKNQNVIEEEAKKIFKNAETARDFMKIKI